MKKYVSRSIEDTAQIAKKWLSEAEGRPPRPTLQGLPSASASASAYVVGLSGHLGAGKTAFVKCVAKELGVKEDITSPTFVIMKIYNIDSEITEKNFGPNFPWKRLVHIDAYRLEKPEEIQAIDFEDTVSDPHNLVMMEWPENVNLANSFPNIKFQIEESGEERSIEIN